MNTRKAEGEFGRVEKAKTKAHVSGTNNTRDEIWGVRKARRDPPAGFWGREHTKTTVIAPKTLLYKERVFSPRTKDG